MQPIPNDVRHALLERAKASSSFLHRFMKLVSDRGLDAGDSTAVDQLEALGEERQAAVAFFKDLEELGCGKFFAGRRGHESRIEWKPFSAIQIAEAFLSEATDSPVTTNENREGSSMTSASSIEAKLHDHVFLLRPDLKTTLRLPLDLTKEEASRLADFIRSLPF